MHKYLRMMLWASVVALSLLSGCSKPVSMVSEDVSGHVWLPDSSAHEGAGFYLHPDGRIMSLDYFNGESIFWEVADNVLNFKNKVAVNGDLGLAIYSPALLGGELTLVVREGDSEMVYHRHEKEIIHADVQYLPQILMDTRISGDAEGNQGPYLQFDVEGGFVRGFGGVNNFRGSLEISGTSELKIGPVMATRMAGPGMDVEIKLFQCLDLVDSFLAIKNDLYFYQDSRLICAFSHE